MKEIEETTCFPTMADTFEFVYVYHMFAGIRTTTARVIAVAFTVAGVSPASASASELLMFEQAGCIYCQRWERDVGALYNRTDEAKTLPLRRVDIRSQSTSGITLASPVRFTPTFVVVENGREIGRITGYSNDNAFWGLLGALAAKLQTTSRREQNRL